MRSPTCGERWLENLFHGTRNGEMLFVLKVAGSCFLSCTGTMATRTACLPQQILRVHVHAHACKHVSRVMKLLSLAWQSTGRSQWVHPRADCVIYGVAVLGASQAAVGVRGFVRGEGWLKAGASVVKQHWGSNLRVQVKEGYEAIFEDDVLIAEHCFPSKFLELCENGTYRAVPPLPPPSRNESFPSVLDGMVELMLVQFPPGYYMLYSAQHVQKPVSVRGIFFFFEWNV